MKMKATRFVNKNWRNVNIDSDLELMTQIIEVKMWRFIGFGNEQINPLDEIEHGAYDDDQDAYIVEDVDTVKEFLDEWKDSDEYGELDYECEYAQMYIPEEMLFGEEQEINKMKILQIIKTYGLSRKALSDKFGIPYRTVQNWCAEGTSNYRECPEYVANMIETILKNGL